MSQLSFRDFLTITDALEETQLDEGKIWDAIKRKLGGKASDEDVQDELIADIKKKKPNLSDEKIEDELERLKKIDPEVITKIKDTQASRDFHARKAAKDAKQTKKPQTTVGTGKSKLNAISGSNATAAQNRAIEREWSGN